MEDIIKGDKYYIIGNKGTGKTALLLYISNYLVKNDSDAICSTILFKSDYNKTESFIKIYQFYRIILLRNQNLLF